MRRDEDSVQVTIVDGLRRGLPQGWRVVSVANKPRSAIQGAREKRMGSWAGFPDLMVLGHGAGGCGACGSVHVPAAWFLEVKAPKGPVKAHQTQVHDDLKDLGFSVAVVRSWNDVVAFAKQNRWPLRIAA
jgi:hypothetical protein